MQNTKRKPNIPGNDLLRKRQMFGTPRSIKSRPNSGQSIKNYIQIKRDNDDDRISKKFPTQEDVKKKKARRKIVDFGPAEGGPVEPIIECFIDKNFVNNPVIIQTGINKSAPIKKINFDVPRGDEHKSVHYDEVMDWRDYHQLSVIYKFMDDLESNFPSLCSTGSIGTSVEGRLLKILKISNSNASNSAVWVDAGIHAREWIAPAVNTYLANHISKNFDSLPECMKNKDWYFLPVVNPDGYDYSHTTDRMWRKNRAWHDGQCVGVDLNRNFSIGWGGRGSSDKPTNAFYRGPEPFSEPESSAMRDLFMNSGINFKVYITLHSYGQIIIFPYACSQELAPDYVRLLQGATAMSKAIYDTNGNTYKVGISRDVMYGAAGTSNDFAHGAAGIPYCYLIELRSKKHKFRLPKQEIEETGNEIYSCVQALMEFVDSYSCNKQIHKGEKLLIENNEVIANKNSSDIYPSNSHMKKRKSYDKRDYSYVKHSDSFMQRDNSYVRWPNVSLKKENLVSMNDVVTGVDGDSLDNYFMFENEGATLDSDDDDVDTKALKCGSFLHMNNSFIQKSNQYRNTNDTYLDKTDSYEQQTNSRRHKDVNFLDKTDSFFYEDDIFLKESTADFSSDYFLLADSQSPPDSNHLLKNTNTRNEDNVSMKEIDVQVNFDDDQMFLNSNDSFWQKESSLALQNFNDQKQYATNGQNILPGTFYRYEY